jgi:undecaprenyl phosphate N,N'-diacetylbacillosamine 1-phosphate transferase
MYKNFTYNYLETEKTKYMEFRKSLVGKIINRICKYEGEKYFKSGFKRRFDLLSSAVLAVFSLPLLVIFCILKKLEDGGPIFFIHKRVDKDMSKSIDLVKIRCMKFDSDAGYRNMKIADGKKSWEDFRNTHLGRLMRRFQIEEIPQIYQVIIGHLYLVGIRPAPRYVFGYLKKKWPLTKYNKWLDAYRKFSPGLIGLNQLYSLKFKYKEEERYELDIYYGESACLNLDIFLTLSTIYRILNFFS